MLSKGRKIPKEHQLNHKVAEMRLVQNLKFYEVTELAKLQRVQNATGFPSNSELILKFSHSLLRHYME